jgi:GTP-binding protein
MFTDQVKLELKAGKGGNGVVAWRREKYIPKGGPSGGDGGNGGSIIIEGCTQIYSLEHYRNRNLIKAEDGGQGGSACRQGKKGEDLIVKVPLGTLVKDGKTGEILCDITQEKQRFAICQGGRGGKGNVRFKSPTNRAPQQSTPGTYGKEAYVELELKLIADIGFVGFPNAGKSTLLEAMTAVKVKIAPYPFTTLRPNLGYLFDEFGMRILLADIPGIIKGASKNKGLGLEFLRHIERTHVLVFVLDSTSTPWEDYKVLLNEVKAYNKELLDKPRAIVLNKIDCEEAGEGIKTFRKKCKEENIFEISAMTGENLDTLISALRETVFSNLSSLKTA